MFLNFKLIYVILKVFYIVSMNVVECFRLVFGHYKSLYVEHMLYFLQPINLDEDAPLLTFAFTSMTLKEIGRARRILA